MVKTHQKEHNIHHFLIVGRHTPTDKNPNPKIYKMRIFADDPVRAKSKFWYFLKKLDKVKKASGDILACHEIFDRDPSKVKTYGIVCTYKSKFGYHNLYKEFRSTSLNGAVDQLTSEMVGRHKAQRESLVIVRTTVIKGKSCIILRYTENIFSQNLMNSIGVDFKLKTIEIDNKIIKLQIWDTAGEERFRTITTSYYKGAQVIIIVYDVTDNDSFEHVKNWINEIDKFAKKDVLKILVGNKCDLISQRKVSTQQGNDLANYYKIPFLETSAKDNNNIEELFVDTCKFFLSKQGNSGNVTNEKKNEREKIDLTGTIIPTDRKKKKCCG